MLKELKFVQGAVAKKDLLPAMTHFRIENGTVRSYNGTLAISSPIDVDIDCIPKADTLVKAINQCDETITLNLTPTGKLSVKSGRFRAFIECLEGQTPHVEPEGQEVLFDGEVLLKAIQTLLPFVGTDASRPWANGMLLRGQSAFATNNVMLVEYWLGIDVPEVVNIPLAALHEIVRVNEPPVRTQLTKGSMTFHYADSRWIRTQLLAVNWPDLDKVLAKESNATPIDARLFEGLESLAGFGDAMGRVYIKDNTLCTSLHEGEGATFDMPGLAFKGCYQIKNLNLLKGVATHADFTQYPEACMFYGDRLRGAIIGMRM